MEARAAPAEDDGFGALGRDDDGFGDLLGGFDVPQPQPQPQPQQQYQQQQYQQQQYQQQHQHQQQQVQQPPENWESVQQRPGSATVAPPPGSAANNLLADFGDLLAMEPTGPPVGSPLAIPDP
jgi:hypothetical protein